MEETGLAPPEGMADEVLDTLTDDTVVNRLFWAAVILSNWLLDLGSRKFQLLPYSVPLRKRVVEDFVQWVGKRGDAKVVRESLELTFAAMVHDTSDFVRRANFDISWNYANQPHEPVSFLPMWLVGYAVIPRAYLRLQQAIRGWLC